MTNEAIAMRIKSGCNELYGELWEQTHGFIIKSAYSFYNRRKDYCDSAGITTDDLIQIGFFALRKAVEAYDPDKGYKLLTYIGYPLLTMWSRVLKPNDMFAHVSSSLDDNISPDADNYCPMSDIVPDPAAQEAMEQVIDNEMQRGLKQAVAAALDTLPDQLKQVLHARYWEDKSYNEIGAQTGISGTQARTLDLNALRELRKHKTRKTLLPFAEEMVDSYAYQGNSYASFIYNQASGVERALELAEKNSLHK